MTSFHQRNAIQVDQTGKNFDLISWQKELEF